ncbi:MAG: RIP metalloprotease RseP [Cytophagaceae bacterium]
MVDESLDTKELSKEPQPWEFRSKPAWQRLIVMMGGIIVNIITGILIMIFVVYIFGEKYISVQELNKRGIVAHKLGKEIGLQTGDKIIAVNGKTYGKYSEILTPEILFSDNSYYTVLRGNDTIVVKIPSDFIGKISGKDAKEGFVEPIFPFQVESVEKGSNAYKAGLKSGDQIVAINDTRISYFHELKETLEKFKGKKINLKILRGGKEITLPVQVTDKSTIGFRPKNLLNNSVEYYGFGESIAKGTSQAFGVITNTVRGFGKIFKGDVNASDAVSGPLGIASQYGGSWEWERFWGLTGMLSMVLAFMNFLPIPALDGGHVVFLMYEMITGRKPSDKFMEIAVKIGMVLLLALMVFAFGNDIFKMFR